MNPKLLKKFPPHLDAVDIYVPGASPETIAKKFGIQREMDKLASNESPRGPSLSAIEAANREMTGVYRYPDGAGTALRQALAEFHDFPVEGILLGNGSNELIELTFRALLTPGDAVYSADVTFAVYKILASAMNVAYRAIAVKDFTYDLPAFAAQVERGSPLVVIADPNNPTGTVVGNTALCAFLDARPDVFVLYDAAYEEYRSDNYIPAAELVKRYPNVIAMKTFSKAYGLAGLRIGYGLAHPDVANRLARVRQPFNTSSVAQAAALAALRDQEHRQATVRLNAEMIEWMQERLEKMGVRYAPTQANFLMLLLAAQPGASEIAQSLLREGSIVRELGGFGMPGALRVNTGTRDQTGRFLDALERIVGSASVSR